MFVTNEPYTPYIKRNGEWTRIEGCTGRIAWGGDGSIYRRSCEASNYGYVEKFNADTDEWEQLGDKYAYEVAAD